MANVCENKDLVRGGLLVSIIMPVFNAQETVELAARKCLEAAESSKLNAELIIIDDGSTDATAQSLTALLKNHSRIVVRYHAKRLGRGAAIRTGIAAMSGDVVVFQDADLEYNPEDYETLFKPILEGQADAVFGSRFMPRQYKKVLRFWHRAGNAVLTHICNMLTDLDLTDMETCYKMIRADVLRSVPLRCNGLSVEPELTMKLAKRGMRIYEVPVSYSGRFYREKKVRWIDGLTAILVMVRFSVIEDLFNAEYGHKFLSDLSLDHCGLNGEERKGTIRSHLDHKRKQRKFRFMFSERKPQGEKGLLV